MTIFAQISPAEYDRHAFEGFKPNANGFLIGNARALMWFSQLAYETHAISQTIQTVFPEWSFRSVIPFIKSKTSLKGSFETCGLVGERADAVILADSGNWRAGQPGLTISLRGIVACDIEVRTLDHAVHSGEFGGPVPDALTVLAKTLATLHDDRGNVAVPGIARGKADPLDLTEEELRKQVGLRPGTKLIGEGSITDRMWMKPSISILGIDAPKLTESTNQLVPSAKARVSMRIPPGQDADAALRALAPLVVSKGSIALPQSIMLSIPVYFGEAPVPVMAFMRRQIDDGDEDAEEHEGWRHDEKVEAADDPEKRAAQRRKGAVHI